MGKGLKWLIAGSVIFSVVVVGGIMAIALTNRMHSSNDSNSYYHPDSNSSSYPQSSDSNDDEDDKLSIRLVFNASNYSNSDILYQTKIYAESFSWNSSLYKGEDPVLVEEGFENTFLGWYSRRYSEVLNEDVACNINDYEFYDDGYQGERKDGKESIFDITKYGNQYICQFWPKFFKKSVNYTVTYQSPSGEIYDVVSVPSRLYGERDKEARLSASYLGRTPTYYNFDYPTKFVGWDIDTRSVNKNMVATAVFDHDFGVTRASINVGGSSFSRDTNGHFITMIHNDSSSTAEVPLYRSNRELREVTIKAHGSLFLDLTDGVDGFSGSINNNSSSKRIIYDYLNDDNYLIPSYNVNHVSK